MTKTVFFKPAPKPATAEDWVQGARPTDRNARRATASGVTDTSGACRADETLHHRRARVAAHAHQDRMRQTWG
jgi:hypothetical protein